MSTYTWQYASIVSTCCSVVDASDRLAAKCQVFCPGAPRSLAVPIDLPTVTATDVDEESEVPQDFFPINLADIPSFQETDLGDIVLTSPIHIHTPTTHLGSIQRGMNGQSVNAKDVILDIHDFARKSVNYIAYTQLSGEMQNLLEGAFMRRRGEPSAASASWRIFSAGENTTSGPIGADLLLGCTAIWGLERFSFEGYSVVHLA